MVKYDAVMFDLDGTLTDSAEGIINCAKPVLDHYGIVVEEEERMKEFIGPPLRETFPRFGIPEEEVQNAIALFRARYTTVGKFENKPYPGIRDLLQELKDAGVRLYVATSKPEITARQVLEKYDLTKYFDEIAGASEDASRDTKDKVIEYLKKKTEDLGSTVMVGDTVYDVEGAKEHGIGCICVDWGYGKTEDMVEAGALCVVETMEELKQKILG